MRSRSLSLAVDLYGCPNRCLHCWLGHMPNLPMEPEADAWIVERFKPFFDRIAFYSWLREPDFCPDYRSRWERDKALSVNAVPERFELASFWRLVRDPDYVHFLKELNVKCVQLSFFGLEQTTDRYVGRRGAFRELLRATEILLENGICPRWQGFLNEENRLELVELLPLSRKLELSRRCAEIGGAFRFFVHEGSCDGENRKLYPIRITRDSIPEELLPFYLDADLLQTEAELCEKWKDEPSHLNFSQEEELVLYVSNQYELFFNYTHMRPEWAVGNLKTEPVEELLRRIEERDTPALRAAREITLGQLVRRYGDPASQRVFDEGDFKIYLLNRHLETAE
ncbi:MAG: radical SAM protein [Oscillospiraceae bacterium]|nr:radical SAM protein [Oscillospiraceae bacterium]